MARLDEYEVDLGGVTVTMKLSPEHAEKARKAGEGRVRPVTRGKARTPANKARGVRNKSTPAA